MPGHSGRGPITTIDGDRMTAAAFKQIAAGVMAIGQGLKIPTDRRPQDKSLPALADQAVWSIAELDIEALREVAELVRLSGIGPDELAELLAKSYALQRGVIDLKLLLRQIRAARRIFARVHAQLNERSTLAIAELFPTLGPDEQKQVLSDLGEVTAEQAKKIARGQKRRDKTHKVGQQLDGELQQAEREATLLQVLYDLGQGREVDTSEVRKANTLYQDQQVADLQAAAQAAAPKKTRRTMR